MHAVLTKEDIGNNITTMAKDVTADKFSEHLFWDINVDEYDIDKYPEWTIQRVLEFGNLSDWKLIYHYFGIERIAQACMKLRTLDRKALNYICLLSNTKKEDYRCYHIRQSNPTLWNS